MMGRKKSHCSRLRHRLTLQQPVRTPDGAGGYVQAWQDVADLWAEIALANGSESKISRGFGRKILFADKMQAEITHRILFRYRQGVTTDMRLVFESRLFAIRAIHNAGEDKEMLELLVQEGVAT